MLNALSAFVVMSDIAPVSKAPHFPLAFTVVLVLGFISATTIGSIAWYNSKRPVGWEGKERPDVVPKVNKEATPGIGNPE